MSSQEERLTDDIDGLVIVSPVLHLATMSLDGRPHSSTVWFAPDEALERLFWLSSPERQHSKHIDMHANAGMTAYVSGSMCKPQRPSRPVAGLSFEGEAKRLTNESEIDEAKSAFMHNVIFSAEEIDAYMSSRRDDPHAVYAATVHKWIDFNGMLPQEECRLELAWPPA